MTDRKFRVQSSLFRSLWFGLWIVIRFRARFTYKGFRISNFFGHWEQLLSPKIRKNQLKLNLQNTFCNKFVYNARLKLIKNTIERFSVTLCYSVTNIMGVTLEAFATHVKHNIGMCCWSSRYHMSYLKAFTTFQKSLWKTFAVGQRPKSCWSLTSLDVSSRTDKYATCRFC
jgi:hypothetical protein